MKIISQAPTRISLVGGGSDLPSYYENHGGGMTISMAVNLYQHIELNDYHNSWVIPENAKKDFYTSFFDNAGVDTSIGMRATCDISIESGMGTSASAAVALLGALYKKVGRKIDKKSIAQKAWFIEVNKLNLFGGKQDQYAASLGGMNILRFYKTEVRVKELSRHIAGFWADHMVLVDTGIKRENIKLQENLKKLNKSQVQSLKKTTELASVASDLIKNLDVGGFANILKEAWGLKKQTNDVTTPEIDKMYEFGLSNGALAGKLLGSGGGGMMLFMVPEGLKENFAKKFANAIDFSPDFNGLMVREVEK